MCLQRKTITSKKVRGPHSAHCLLNTFWRPIKHHVNCRQQCFHHPSPSHLHTSFLGAERRHVHFSIFQQQSLGGWEVCTFLHIWPSWILPKNSIQIIYIIFPLLTPTSRLAEGEGNILGKSLPQLSSKIWMVLIGSDFLFYQHMGYAGYF